MASISTRKLGRIMISPNFLENYQNELFVLFGKFIPLYIKKPDLLKNQPDFCYTGFCEAFDLVAEGDSIPLYEAVFTIEDEGDTEKNIQLTFEKLTNKNQMTFK